MLLILSGAHKNEWAAGLLISQQRCLLWTLTTRVSIINYKEAAPTPHMLKIGFPRADKL